MTDSLIFNQIRDGLPPFVMPLSVCMITQDYSSQFVLLPPQPKLLFMGKTGEIRTQVLKSHSHNLIVGKTRVEDDELPFGLI